MYIMKIISVTDFYQNVKHVLNNALPDYRLGH